MKDYGTVRSTVQPEEIDINETSVFVASNIRTVTVDYEGESHTEYEYELVGYTKDEYIADIQASNESLAQQVTDTQLALCDVYEMLL